MTKLLGIAARLPLALALYQAVLAIGAASLAVWFIASEGAPEHLWQTGALAVVAATAERWRAQLGEHLEASVSLLAMVFAAVLFGPLPALIVAVASTSSDFRRPFLRWGIYTSSRAVTGALTGIAANEAAGIPDGRVAGIVAAAALGALVAEILDIAFASVTMRLRRRSSILQVVRTLAPAIAASVPLYAPLVAVLVVAYEALSAWTLPLFFVPAMAAQRLFVLYENQRQLAEELTSANEQLERANLSFAAALVATLDARDQYTAGHSAAVAIYARDIAKRMGLSEADQQLVHLCGLVHDIGKVGLSPGLLEKPGSLTLEERREMERHSEIGERILANVDDYSEIAKVVRHHHERFDGQGYPDRLAGDAIPLLSRILAVADAYNAMTSDRPYRDAMPSRVARFRMAQAVETQFDTAVVAAFEAVLAGASEAYRGGERVDFGLDEQRSRLDAVVATVA